MPGMTSEMNQAVVQTELDDVFMQEWNFRQQAGHVDAMSSEVFIQDTTTSAAVIEEIFKGTGLWGKREESEDVQSSDSRIQNKITFNVVNLADSIDIPKNFFDDNMHSSYEKMVKNFGEMARVTRDENAFSLFRNAFTTTLTADGLTLVSDAHITISGATVDNKMTEALTEESLNTAIIKLGEQKDQAGVVRGSQPKTLLVPLALFKYAMEITGSELRQGTADNDMNVYSTSYGINVATTNRLGAVIEGGSDTAWFLLGSNHSATRWVRQGIVTTLVDWRLQRNNSYIYKGEFREMVGVLDYVGVVGSTGTA